MPDLIAQGPNSKDRWRRELPSASSGVQILVGRSGADWNVPWEPKMSRAHLRITADSNDRVDVQCLTTARNPVFHRGKKVLQCRLVPGEHFVVGETTFTLANRPGTSDAPPGGEVTEHLFDHHALRRRHFRDAAARIEMLGKLPDLITRSGSDEELLVRVTSVLLQSTPAASAVAIVKLDPAAAESAVAGDADVSILHYDTRAVDIGGLGPQGTGHDPPISSRLVRSAVGRRESVLQLWSGHRGETAAFTAAEGVDWAFCVPLRNESCPGWGIYVTGQRPGFPGDNPNQPSAAAPDDLHDDVKFAELVGTTIANLRQSLRLERRQAGMRRFFAPVVMEALAGRNTDEVLAPRETRLSVMFCDLRGFSRRSEQESDQLFELLEQVSDALGVMTRHILDSGGVIGDFHGDAAMGFWGWPLEQTDIAGRAAGAAARILRANRNAGVAEQFRCGIGIATGRAVAGRIGTVDQVKVTAFGPVVNLASRLEGMTKAFGAEIVIDQTTADDLRGQHPFRLRRLARVRPSGMQLTVDAYELLVTSDDAGERILNEQQVALYEAALDALITGDWGGARQRLSRLPQWDQPTSVLLATIDRHDGLPPEHWQGVIDVPKL